MLKILLKLFFIFTCVFLQAQKKEYWLIDAKTLQKKIIKDSAQSVKFLDSLVENGHFFTQLNSVKKAGSITEIVFDKGNNYNKGYITLPDSLAIVHKIKNNDYIYNIDSVKQKINQNYIQKGFLFNRIKAEYQGMKNDFPMVKLTLIPDKKREITDFVIKGYERVPKRFVKNLNKEFKGKVYDERNLKAISQSLQNHPFLLEQRSPQTLFTKDSTNIFLYLQKKKSSTFDGVLGFGNAKNNKFTLNGTINAALRNMFNGFESIEIYWQRNPDNGQTFNLNVDVPYLFKSNIGLNTTVNIFRQDSTFANVKFNPSLYYNLSFKQKLGVRANFEISSILSKLYTSGQDYTKNGLGVWYQYSEPSEVELFITKTKIRAEADYVNAHYSKDNTSAKQTHYFLLGERNFHINGNNYLYAKVESALMNSSMDFTSNELLRFGGWNSMRGFNENSVLANFYAFASAEYRYVIGEQAFFDAFLQYGSVRNELSKINTQLYSIGTGFNFRLPIGIMSFQISNGNFSGNPFRFQDTKIHWGIVSKF